MEEALVVVNTGFVGSMEGFELQPDWSSMR